MARTKERWVGRPVGAPFLDGRTVIIPVRLDHDPTRLVEIRVSLSAVDRHLLGVERAADWQPDASKDVLAEDLEPVEPEEEEEEAQEEPPPSRVQRIKGRHSRLRTQARNTGYARRLA